MDIRVRVILLLLALLLFVLSGCSNRTELVTELQEADGNEVLAALLNAGIEAGKSIGKDGSVSVWVEPGRLARAIDVLREQGLPRPRHSRMGEVFKKENLISSPLEERARYVFALSQEMERTLGAIDGVVVARVHVVMAERSIPGESPLPSSAAVFLKYQLGFGVEALQAQVKSLVASAIAGLSEDRVTVVLVPSKVQASGAAPGWEEVFAFRVEEGMGGRLRLLIIVSALLTVAAIVTLAFSFLSGRNVQLRVARKWLGDLLPLNRMRSMGTRDRK